MQFRSDHDFFSKTFCHETIVVISNFFLLIGSKSKYEERLGVLIDHKLTFENHLLNIIQKVDQKLHALAGISKYMPQKKLRITMKAFVSSQFAYCPLIWMFHSRQINYKINKLHQRALRIVYNDHFFII